MYHAWFSTLVRVLCWQVAEQTPLSALRVGGLALEAGLPAGVLNIIQGSGGVTGAALSKHTGVNKVCWPAHPCSLIAARTVHPRGVLLRTQAGAWQLKDEVISSVSYVLRCLISHSYHAHAAGVHRQHGDRQDHHEAGCRAHHPRLVHVIRPLTLMPPIRLHHHFAWCAMADALLNRGHSLGSQQVICPCSHAGAWRQVSVHHLPGRRHRRCRGSRPRCAHMHLTSPESITSVLCILLTFLLSLCFLYHAGVWMHT